MLITVSIIGKGRGSRVINRDWITYAPCTYVLSDVEGDLTSFLVIS